MAPPGRTPLAQSRVLRFAFWRLHCHGRLQKMWAAFVHLREIMPANPGDSLVLCELRKVSHIEAPELSKP
jgi:hypothetical protein